MSFDILILKLKLPETENLAEVEDVLEIGQPEVIASVINEYFPNCLESYFMAEKGYSFEASLNGSPVESVHATLRFGNNWSELASNEFYSGSQEANSLKEDSL